MYFKTKEVYVVEQHLGRVLIPVRMEQIDAKWHQAYCLDEQNRLVGLSLALSHKEDLSFLKNLPYLEKLFLRISGVVEIRFVRSEMVMHKQYLEKYNLDLSFLQNLAVLEELGIQNACITQTEDLTTLQNIQKIQISHSEITDANFLESVKNLERIFLNHNEFSGKVLLFDLPNLKEIIFEGNQIEALHLRNLPALQKVDICDNPLKTLTIEKCDSLNNIRLENTQLTSFEIHNLPALHQIRIQNAPITNLSFANLPALQILHLENLPLKKIQTASKLVLDVLILRNCRVNNVDLRLYLEAFEAIAATIAYPDLEARLEMMRTEFETQQSITYHHTQPLKNIVSMPKVGKLILDKKRKYSEPDNIILVVECFVNTKATDFTVGQTFHFFEKSFDFQQVRHLDLSNNKLVNIDFLFNSNVETLILNNNGVLKLDIEVLESLLNLKKLEIDEVTNRLYYTSETVEASKKKISDFWKRFGQKQ